MITYISSLCCCLENYDETINKKEYIITNFGFFLSSFTFKYFFGKNRDIFHYLLTTTTTTITFSIDMIRSLLA